MKKKILRKRVIIPVVIILLIVILVTVLGKKQTKMMYLEDTAAVRDISTYMKFTGKVEATDSKKVYSSVAAKVKEVLVEEGQKVKKGDVLYILDSKDIEYAIESKELSLEQTKTMNEYNLKDAKTSLYNLQSSINQGLNSSVNMAQKTLLSEQDMYYAKVDAYNTTMEAYVKAKADYDSGKAYQAAANAVMDAGRALDNLKAENNFAESALPATTTKFEYERNYSEESAEISLARAQKNLEDAKKAALDNVNDLKEKADKALEAVNEAERNMESAKRDYDTTLLSVNQNLQVMRNTVEKIEATSSTKTQELDIEHTKDTLDNYIIKATMDGYITSLAGKEGELINSTLPVAEIANFDKMEIAVKVDEYDIGKIYKDMPVSIYINAFDKYFDGKIDSFDMTATTTTDVSFFNAKVSFDTDGSIMSGLSAEAKITKLDKKGVLTVKAQSIFYGNDNTAYCKIKGSKGEPIDTPVTVGDTDGTFVEIIDGLKEGDVIYYTPSDLLELYLSAE